jgi:hypothetical protein
MEEHAGSGCSGTEVRRSKKKTAPSWVWLRCPSNSPMPLQDAPASFRQPLPRAGLGKALRASPGAFGHARRLHPSRPIPGASWSAPAPFSTILESTPVAGRDAAASAPSSARVGRRSFRRTATDGERTRACAAGRRCAKVETSISLLRLLSCNKFLPCPPIRPSWVRSLRTRS